MKDATKVSFKTTKNESKSIRAIAERAVTIAKKSGIAARDQSSIEMDLAACHANCIRIDFDRLLAADDWNLAHDVFGIGRYLDRSTGELTGHFLPRFASREQPQRLEDKAERRYARMNKERAATLTNARN